MPSIRSTVTAVLAFLTIINATPVDIRKRKAFTLNQVERGKFIKNGPKAKLNALRKYGLAVPDNLLAAATARTDEISTYYGPLNGSAPAVPKDEFDSLYLTPTQCGEDEVQLDFDTGSADLWVFSSLQPRSQLEGHQYYNVSSGKEMVNHTWSILYGDGSGARGKVYTDKVIVGGITVKDQAIGAATTVSQSFLRDVNTDGLLGLSFSSLNTIRPTPQLTWFEKIKDELAEPLFAVTLKYHSPGSYDFGYIDKSKYTGEITYVDVNDKNGWWEFNITGFAVGAGAETAINTNAITDTGTTLSYLPADIVTAYYTQVPEAENSWNEGGWIFPCTASLPDLAFTIGGKVHTIPGEHLTYAPLTRTSTTCYGGLQDGSEFGFSILGDTWLKSLYVIHEFKGAPRVGIAKQAGLD